MSQRIKKGSLQCLGIHGDFVWATVQPKTFSLKETRPVNAHTWEAETLKND